MGCISSKGMGRSMSIHEQFNQGFHMTTHERDRIITLIKIASGKNLRGFRYVEADTDEPTLCAKPCATVEAEQDGKERKSLASGSTERPEISNLGQSDQGSTGCRSFHTLEEFEELIEKVKRFEARILEMAGESEPGADPTTRHSFETCPSSSTDGENISTGDSLSQDNIPKVNNTPKNVVAAAGWKRKAMSRELESLMLPNTVKAELSSVGSLKEWIHAGDDIYSLETYVTPKFGSYAIERREFGLFSPELVAAFEECMEQMEAEEAGIVKQMEESLRQGEMYINPHQ